MDNFDLKKYLVENKITRNSRMLNEDKTPRYPEGKLSIKDKIKAIVPLWRQYLQSDDRLLQSQIKDEISKYTTYDDEFGGGSYVFDILDNAQSIEDVAKIVMKNEKDNNTSQQQYSVELLVPTIYFNVETGELAKSKYDFGAESELEDMDITSYSDGEELIKWVFDNDYDTAKSFEREYPGLFKVVTRNSKMLREKNQTPDLVSMRVFLEELNINPEDPLFASAIKAGNIEEVITLLIDTAGNGDTENPFDGVYTQSDFSEAARAAQFSEEMIDELLSMTPIRTLEKG